MNFLQKYDQGSIIKPDEASPNTTSNSDKQTKNMQQNLHLERKSDFSEIIQETLILPSSNEKKTCDKSRNFIEKTESATSQILETSKNFDNSKESTLKISRKRSNKNGKNLRARSSIFDSFSNIREGLKQILYNGFFDEAEDDIDHHWESEKNLQVVEPCPSSQNEKTKQPSDETSGDITNESSGNTKPPRKQEVSQSLREIVSRDHSNFNEFISHGRRPPSATQSESRQRKKVGKEIYFALGRFKPFFQRYEDETYIKQFTPAEAVINSIQSRQKITDPGRNVLNLAYIGITLSFFPIIACLSLVLLGYSVGSSSPRVINIFTTVTFFFLTSLAILINHAYQFNHKPFIASCKRLFLPVQWGLLILLLLTTIINMGLSYSNFCVRLKLQSLVFVLSITCVYQFISSHALSLHLQDKNTSSKARSNPSSDSILYLPTPEPSNLPGNTQELKAISRLAFTRCKRRSMIFFLGLIFMWIIWTSFFYISTSNNPSLGFLISLTLVSHLAQITIKIFIRKFLVEQQLDESITLMGMCWTTCVFSLFVYRCMFHGEALVILFMVIILRILRTFEQIFTCTNGKQFLKWRYNKDHPTPEEQEQTKESTKNRKLEMHKYINLHLSVYTEQLQCDMLMGFVTINCILLINTALYSLDGMDVLRFAYPTFKPLQMLSITTLLYSIEVAASFLLSDQMLKKKMLTRGIFARSLISIVAESCVLVIVNIGLVALVSLKPIN